MKDKFDAKTLKKTKLTGAPCKPPHPLLLDRLVQFLQLNLQCFVVDGTHVSAPAHVLCRRVQLSVLYVATCVRVSVDI